LVVQWLCAVWYGSVWGVDCGGVHIVEVGLSSWGWGGSGGVVLRTQSADVGSSFVGPRWRLFLLVRGLVSISELVLPFVLCRFQYFVVFWV
jgi:hypothetical protein